MSRYVIYDSYDNDEWNEDDSMQLEWEGQSAGHWAEAFRSFCSKIWTYSSGPLSDRAYKRLLEHFGLCQYESVILKEQIICMSPAQLFQLAGNSKDKTDG